MRYEYKVIPAPTRGPKAKGVRSTKDRFAHALQTAMNDLGADDAAPLTGTAPR
jgi:hypothetical protein